MEEQRLFIELSIIVISTLILSGIMRILKQPIMIGYIIVGILLSPQVFGIMESHHSIATFSQIGITILLFMVGLHLNPKNVKETGKVSIVTGITQVCTTTLLGYLAGLLMGLGHVVSIYIAIGLSFSSTIVIMKLLSDKKDLHSLYGRISTGILIVQDLIAMIVLMVISAISKEGDINTLILSTVLKSVGIISVLYFFSKYALPKLLKKVASSQEVLLLFSIGWCMALASVFYFLDFSIEIGALLAGITLSMSPYRYEISSKMRPLRDFFVMLFFVLMGAEMDFSSINQFIFPIIAFSLLVLIGNPLIIMSTMGLMGYTKKNSFKTALTCAQISEFSLIMLALAIKVGQVPANISSMLTMIGILTIIGSTYFIIYDEKIFNALNKFLDVFERKGHKVDQHIKHSGEKHDIVVLGFSKLGSEIVKGLSEKKKKFLVVDFDPRNIRNLTRQSIDCRYGDIGNAELFDELNFEKTKMIISTIKDFDTNLLLIHKIRKINQNAIIIVVSHQIDEALRLYQEGVNYVIMPNYIGGNHTSGIIAEYGYDIDKFLQEKNIHVNQLLIKKQINFGKN
ncbi:sodium:proton exchanger [Candidatus Peregrinibacteria bacterium]|nr:sodium:proton exchanger [Candidatus Peregrinibacteria bacterium]